MRNKYGNTKIERDGILFDSRSEYARWSVLKLMERAGEITELERQIVYELQPKFRDNNGKAWQSIKFTVDFRYKEKGITVVEDVKGFADARWSVKERLFRYKYPLIDLRVIK